MGRLEDLVGQAARMLGRDDPDSLWRAYAALESAILDVKVRHTLEHEQPPPPPKRTAKKDVLVAQARSGLAQIDLQGDRKKLLYDLRACRDALKAALAAAKA